MFQYKLFPRLEYLAYLKKIHVSYFPGRPQTDIAKRLIMRMTSKSIKEKYPELDASWELLAYDAPASVDVVFKDGSRYRTTCEEYSRRQLEDIVDGWKMEAEFQEWPEHRMQLSEEQKKRLEELDKAQDASGKPSG
uniref:Uncharacterized protein n=1 Tax=Chromera velia CCMP2878 TaxID=1169474 RepID=A0A0G4IEG7_9ALVE|mmetsp:Transcript_42645/g.84117  ORF Transcript_42645/g.84117 Transcript_42645/m.84117 type:complete len:136 (-) Transcript_42645:117-524(-)|eukprot:Cvel_13593.t1-p1 / transcript=Cvel_13593.t1 / gene=Cvel_13593 / organism=Chromera_velia_CCMP2878 / gene_product=hypothetical protein / transcript_product=hypothetical protein / location=Cvel_scaffold935:28501-31274(-) / protein_length=135 / sequence_SO=supercontig / SO=protein_coding / is_pseudo=false